MMWRLDDSCPSQGRAQGLHDSAAAAPENPALTTRRQPRAVRPRNVLGKKDLRR